MTEFREEDEVWVKGVVRDDKQEIKK